MHLNFYVLLVVFICGLLKINNVNASLLHGEPCPKVSPMKDINVTQLVGDWYLIIANEHVLDEKDICFRSNFYIPNNQTLEIRTSWISSNGMPLQLRANYSINAKNIPNGVLRFDEEVTINGLLKSYKKNVTSDLVIVATDYYNYQLLYSCNQLKHFWVSEHVSRFFLLIRTRYFDSFRILAPLIINLKSLKIDLNKISFIENSILCPN